METCHMTKLSVKIVAKSPVDIPKSSTYSCNITHQSLFTKALTALIS
jgi:hypothetical protein